MNLISVTPFTRILDRWIIKDQELLDLFHEIPGNFRIRNFNEEQLWDIRGYHFNPYLQQKAFIHIIGCTVFDYPHVFTSEKNIKPFICKRPFILVSSPGSLKNLRDMGFKTFSDFWSEDYDQILDPTLRLKTIFKLITDINSLSLNQLKEICNGMKDILEHNYNFLFYSLEQDQTLKFEEQCQANLGIR